MGRRGAPSRPVERRELVIERLVAGGDGLARDDGRVVFVPATVVGDRAIVELVQVKRDFARGRLVEVLDPGEGRVEPRCPEVARGCGGCDWQHLDPDAQLAAKAEIVREALRRTAKLPDASVAVGGAVQPWAYRTSMRAVAGRDWRLGLRRAASHDVVSLHTCHVVDPRLDDLRRSITAAPGDEVSIRISVSSGEVTTGPDDAPLVEHIGEVSLRVSPESFFQSGPEAAALLVDTVRSLCGDALGSATQVIDAYGGVGLFAACLAPDAPDARWTLLEGSASSCADARVNLDPARATVVEGPVEDWVAPAAVDLVIADPSRAGLGAAAVTALAAAAAPVMILVSCDPVALARDANLLHTEGYAHRHTIVLDLFPQTHHVEAVTRFDRRHVPPLDEP
jgi:23S rRNA (uracil1939-C5)-methyltransferase